MTQLPAKVGLCFDLVSDAPRRPSDPPDRYDELDEATTIDALEAALREAGMHVERIGGVHALVDRLARNALDVDLVFNVAEGLRGRAREAQVPALLEAYGVPYTGADPTTLAVTLDKALTKRLWMADALPTAPFLVASSEQDLNTLFRADAYFVKPAAEGSSIGVLGASRASDRVAVAARVRDIVATYHEPAIIEPFLPGREVTVGIVDVDGTPTALGVLEIATGQGHWERDAKHAAVAGEVQRPYRAVENDELEREAQRLALAAYVSVGGRDMARIDLRCDADGTLQLLEINALPGLVPGGSLLPVIATRAGQTYTELIVSIVRAAWRRYATMPSASDDSRGAVTQRPQSSTATSRLEVT